MIIYFAGQNETMRLNGNRMMIAGEPGLTVAFDAARVKSLSGADSITAREVSDTSWVLPAPKPTTGS